MGGGEERVPPITLTLKKGTGISDFQSNDLPPEFI